MLASMSRGGSSNVTRTPFSPYRDAVGQELGREHRLAAARRAADHGGPGPRQAAHDQLVEGVDPGLDPLQDGGAVEILRGHATVLLDPEELEDGLVSLRSPTIRRGRRRVLVDRVGVARMPACSASSGSASTSITSTFQVPVFTSFRRRTTFCSARRELEELPAI